MALNRLLLTLRFTCYILRISAIILFVSVAFSEELAVKGLKSDGPLAWTNPVLEVLVGLADERCQATFHFVNQAGKPVSIIKVQPACGCTTAELAAYEYAPTGAGDLVATLEIGSMTGRQQKRIVVTTQFEGDSSPHEQEIALIA